MTLPLRAHLHIAAIFLVILSLPFLATSLACAQSRRAVAPPATPKLSNLIAPKAKIEKVAGNFGFVEGPAWHNDALLFTDIPGNRIMRWQQRDGIGIFREPSRNANGLAFDNRNRLVACEHGARRVSRTEPDGTLTPLAERYEGKRLNSPNDLAFFTDGSIYFTDPPYGLPNEREGKELDFNGVYRLTPQGKLTLLVRDFERPNGIVFSPDRRTLYVADTTREHVRAFDVRADGTLTNDRIFARTYVSTPASAGGPDGMKTDVRGNLYVTSAGGVWVFDRAGKTLGVIATPEVPANCGFGEQDQKTLYITARTSVYRIRLTVAGAKP